MKRPVIVVAMSLCLSSLPAVVSADTLIMRDGTRVQGTVVGIVSRTITFRHFDGVTRRYPTSQVEGLEFVSADRANPRAASSHRLEAPARTELAIRTTETIDSRNSSPDQVFSAIVERDSTDLSGRVIVPRGSSAQLIIRQLSTGATASPEMVLDLQSITIDGRRYFVSTIDMPFDSGTGLGKNRRTAEMVGGGAAVGTIIGAIAGGANGAAIGVLVGAAGGAGAQVLTRGHDVRVPAETAIVFRLDNSATLDATH